MSNLPLTSQEIAEYRAGILDVDGDVFERLYTHYCNSGEMPYGVAKARTGDPYAWIEDRLAETFA